MFNLKGSILDVNHIASEPDFNFSTSNLWIFLTLECTISNSLLPYNSM